MKSGYCHPMTGTGRAETTAELHGREPVSGYQVTADPLTPASPAAVLRHQRRAGIFEDQVTFPGNMPETGAPPRHEIK